jgi:hypothetical protein
MKDYEKLLEKAEKARHQSSQGNDVVAAALYEVAAQMALANELKLVELGIKPTSWLGDSGRLQ